MLNISINDYEGRCDIMGKDKKDKKDTDKNKIKNFIKSNLFETIIVSIIIPVFGFVLGFLWTFNANISSLNTKVESIDQNTKEISEIRQDIATINTDIALLNEKNNSFESDLNGFKNTNNQIVVYKPTDKVSRAFIYTTAYNDSDFLPSPTWSDEDIIAENPHTGRKYKAKNLKNKKILLPYTEGNKDVYFFGQFNKYNHWDGDCIINVYKDKKLNMIMEGRYTDGKLIEYKQVFHFKNSSKKKVWSISERTVSGNKNAGETYTYFKTKNKKSDFNKNTVESSDILSIMDFKEWLNAPVEGYYYGNTSGGKYNDTTGNAYLVKFHKKDGTVRTLYCGNFENGLFEDNTNNAWYISRDNEYNTYIYYKGNFSNNKPCETSTNKRENISNYDIHKIIDNMKFNCNIELRGDKHNVS